MSILYVGESRRQFLEQHCSPRRKCMFAS